MSYWCILLLSVVGCSSYEQVTSGTVADEDGELQKVAYQSLSNSIKNEIINAEQGEVSGFKSGSKKEVFNDKKSKKIDIKDTQTIKVTFATKEDWIWQLKNG